MGTLGKVLLFVNLVAALGLTYFAAQDWQRRQEVTALALRYNLVLKGLPVDVKADGDDVPLNLELTGGQTVGSVRKSLLAAHFQGSTGDGEFADPAAPISQLAELSRAKGKLDAVLAGKGGAAERLAYLCGTLAPGRGGQPTFTPGLLARLATTYDERSAVVALASAAGAGADAAATRARELLDARFTAAQTIDAQKANADATAVKEQADIVRKAAADADAAFKKYQADLAAAQQAYDASPKGPNDVLAAKAAFEAAGKGYEPAKAALKAALDKQADGLAQLAGTASRDATDQRRRVARLLSELDPAAGWQKRVALVVGLRTYREATGEQVDRLGDMIRAAQAQAVSDQAEFTETYLRLKQQAEARTLVLAQQRQVTADLIAQQAKEREITALRRTQFLTRQADLLAVRTEVAEALAAQTKVEAELFAVEKQVGETLRLNFDLEEQLQKAEYRASGK